MKQRYSSVLNSMKAGIAVFVLYLGISIMMTVYVVNVNGLNPFTEHNGIAWFWLDNCTPLSFEAVSFGNILPAGLSLDRNDESLLKDRLKLRTFEFLEIGDGYVSILVLGRRRATLLEHQLADYLLGGIVVDKLRGNDNYESGASDGE